MNEHIGWLRLLDSLRKLRQRLGPLWWPYPGELSINWRLAVAAHCGFVAGAIMAKIWIESNVWRGGWGNTAITGLIGSALLAMAISIPTGFAKHSASVTIASALTVFLGLASACLFSGIDILSLGNAAVLLGTAGAALGMTEGLLNRSLAAMGAGSLSGAFLGGICGLASRWLASHWPVKRDGGIDLWIGLSFLLSYLFSFMAIHMAIWSSISSVLHGRREIGGTALRILISGYTQKNAEKLTDIITDTRYDEETRIYAVAALHRFGPEISTELKSSLSDKLRTIPPDKKGMVLRAAKDLLGEWAVGDSPTQEKRN